MKKKSFIGYCLVLWAMASGVFAQQSTAILKGHVTDQENKPLPFANVALYKSKDSTLVKVGVTEENGNFEFENLQPQSYYLNVSYVGYSDFKGNMLVLGENQTLQLPPLPQVFRPVANQKHKTRYNLACQTSTAFKNALKWMRRGSGSGRIAFLCQVKENLTRRK